MRKRSFLVTTIATFWLSQVAPVAAQDAKQLYEQTCAMCHGTGGKGDGPTSQSLLPKPADLTVVVKDKSDAYLTKLITEGGPSVGKSPLMPSYKGILTEKQVESVVQYVKGLAR